MRLGVIGRADNSGLGTMTVDFCREMKPAKTLILNYSGRGATDPARVPGCTLVEPGRLSHAMLEGFCDDIDAIVGFETFYDPCVLAVAMRRKLPTILFPMWECTPEWCKANTMICLSDQDTKYYRGSPQTRWPVRREDRPPQVVRKPPALFVHNAGSLGLNGRNGTREVLQASKGLVGTNAELLVRTAEPLPYDWVRNQNATITSGWVPADQLYSGYDCLVFPMRIAGLSLPMNEAAASRIPTIVLDWEELAHYPSQMRVRSTVSEFHDIGHRRVEYRGIDIDHLASMMRGLAMGDIEAEAPPEPATWDEFREFWKSVC